MANKKNQHYVPQFYLKLFSQNNNRKGIGIFYIKTNFHYDYAPINSQACKNYFYGKELEIEDWLGKLEDITAKCFQDIIRYNSLPPRSVNYQDALLKFVLLFEFRNPVGGENFENMLNTFAKKYPNISNIPTGSKIKIENPSTIKLAIYEKAVECCKDLKVKLLINTTSKPFIISDNPMIKYNQLLERHKFPYGITGFMSKELQIFLPISSAHMLIFYDSSTYKMGNMKDDNVLVTDEKEIDQLNIMQCLNAYDVIFYNHYSNNEYIRNLMNKTSKYQKPNQPILIELYDPKANVPNKVTKQSNFVVQSVSEIRIKLYVNFMQELSVSKIKSLNPSQYQIRPKVLDNYKRYSLLEK